MAIRKISYIFKKQPRQISFAYDKFKDMHEAVAAAENIDLTAFLRMEQQVAATSKTSAAVKSYREEYFKKLGFEQITMLKIEDE